ncbi:MAG: hypothetical protein V3Q69_01655 [Burkholderia sp.]
MRVNVNVNGSHQIYATTPVHNANDIFNWSGIWLCNSMRISTFCCSLRGRCCINRARSIDVYAQQSRGQIPIKSDSRVTA